MTLDVIIIVEQYCIYSNIIKCYCKYIKTDKKTFLSTFL